MVVIGDVHGCLNTLELLVDHLPDPRHVCFVGDLIDRGPSSAGTVRYVREKGYPCILGNHELMAIQAFDDWESKGDRSTWGWWVTECGGSATLVSYGIDPKTDSIPRCPALIDDIRWFRTLPLTLRFPENKNKAGKCLLVSHSIAMPYLGKESHPDYADVILWGRYGTPPLYHAEEYPDATVYNVFGHTIQKSGVPFVNDSFAVIDTGAFLQIGLSALSFPDMEVFHQPTID